MVGIGYHIGGTCLFLPALGDDTRWHIFTGSLTAAFLMIVFVKVAEDAVYFITFKYERRHI